MATLVLGIAGKAIGGAIGGTIFGMTAAAFGGAVGSFVGSVIDQRLFATKQSIEGPRVESLPVTGSGEGAVLPVPWGRKRFGGTLIYAEDFKEKKKKKGGGGGKGGPSEPEVTTYTYSVSLAVAVCEGEIAGIGRIWVDGEEMDLKGVTWRWYPGSETQDQDPLLVSKLGVENTPAYLGTAYVVFEDLQLKSFGNRIPQFNFEVFAPRAEPDTAEGQIRSVALIPGSGEFALGTTPVRTTAVSTVTAPWGLDFPITTVKKKGYENRATSREATDIEVALDRLEASLPAVENVNLVVCWFGDDLRAGSCSLRPKVENAEKTTSPVWSVNGVDRASATVVSSAGGNIAYGGTPADFTVVEAIAELKARGYRVTLYPMVLMDIADGNSLPDPYSDNAGTSGQPAYPWRGRITCSPAAGYVGTVDKTATAKTQVDAFFGAAQGSDFSIGGSSVSWTGGADWGYRRMILHYAHLATVAGGVDAFLIGTELRGLTHVRDEVAGHYPAVDQLQTLIEDVRTIFEAGGFEKYTNIVTDPSDSDMNAKGSINKRRQMDLSGEGWQIHPGSTSLQTNIDNFARTDALFGDYLTNRNDTLWHAAFLDIDVTAIAGQEVEFTFNGVGYSNSTMVDRSLDLEVYTYTQAQLDDNDGSLLNPSNPGTQHVNVTRWYATHSDGTRYFPESFTFTIPAGTAVLRIAFDLPPSTNIVGWQARAAVQYMRINQLNAPGTFPQLSYAADWSEYFGHQPDDGTGDVFFNLDPLWAADDCDFVGIDNYMPLADWRDGFGHLDALAGWHDTRQHAYLLSNVAGGEGYDWYYASQADRDAQVRTPITDGAYSKPWVFRYKDIRSWWSNQHYDRPGGGESGSPTAWAAEMKPFRFTEIGCPAVDRGANQPNVFPDPKSAESALPYYSRGGRDDAVQRAYLEAVLGYYEDAANNPVSSVYGAPMIDRAECAVWAWDARPYPWFPGRSDLWADGDNWQSGHWLTGRMGAVSLRTIVRAICRKAGLTDEQIDVSDLWGLVDGYAIETISSGRAAIAPLARLFGFDATESEGVIRFFMRTPAPVATLSMGELVQADGDGAFELVRGQETELPARLKWAVHHAGEEYGVAQVEAVWPTTVAKGTDAESFPVATPPEEAQRQAMRALAETWAAIDTGALQLPPSRLALDPGDLVLLEHDGRQLPLRLSTIEDALGRRAAVVRHDRAAYDLPTRDPRPVTIGGRDQFTLPATILLDLPWMSELHTPHRPFLAAFMAPWPGEIAVYRSLAGTSFSLLQTIGVSSDFGQLAAALPAGPIGIWDDASVLDIILASDGELASVDDLDLFAGANAVAVEGGDGTWEIVQAGNVTLVSEGRYQLTHLLRGQRGSAWAMGDPAPAGARVVVLDGDPAEVQTSQADIGVAWTWRIGPASDPVSEDSYVEGQFTPQGRGLVCFSPVQPRLALDAASGDLTLSWIRRDRDPIAQSWTVATPMSEASEAYDVEIVSLDGLTVLRTLSGLTTPQTAYPVAEQTADYGGAVTMIRARIYQIGTLGRGDPLDATVTVSAAS